MRGKRLAPPRRFPLAARPRGACVREHAARAAMNKSRGDVLTLSAGQVDVDKVPAST